MRCKACDAILDDFEACLQSPITDDYLDLCTGCLYSIKDDIEWLSTLLDGNKEDENDTS